MILGLVIVIFFQIPVGAVESMFGGMAAMSPEFLKWKAALSIGQIIIVIGIVIMIPAIILKKKDSRKKETEHICSYCNFVATTETELTKHLAENHLEKSPYKCQHCDFIGITEII